MKLNASSQDRVSKKWDMQAQAKMENRPRKYARHSSVVQRIMNQQYAPGVGDKVTYVKEKYFPDVEIEQALELGGGIGDYAIHVSQVTGCKNLMVYDLSQFSVETGNKRAKEEGLPIQFERVDLNELRLKESAYDLIYASNALHHVENLENLFEQVGLALKPNGFFFCVDYMGPDYMQWTDEQFDIMNRLLSIFPDAYAQNSLREGTVDKQIRRIPLETFAEVDPSEGVRASAIIPAIETNLEIVEQLPLGETLLYELLRGRIHNFDDDDEQDAFLLKLLAIFEKVLVDYNVLTSDFNFIVARDKNTA